MRFYFYSNWSPREVTDWSSIYDLTRLTHFCYSCVVSGSSIMTMTHSIFEQPPASIPIIDCSDKCFCPGLWDVNTQRMSTWNCDLLIQHRLLWNLLEYVGLHHQFRRYVYMGNKLRQPWNIVFTTVLQSTWKQSIGCQVHVVLSEG